MPKAQDAWQGSADGLCGIYCCLYVIENSKALGRVLSKKRERGLYYLLQSAEDNLKPRLSSLIAGPDSGFAGDDLVRVFNGVSSRFRAGYTAATLSSVCKGYDGGFGCLKELFASGGKAVVDVDGGGHWVLATELQPDGSVLCRDPSARRRVESRKRASTDDGVAFFKRNFRVKI